MAAPSMQLPAAWVDYAAIIAGGAAIIGGAWLLWNSIKGWR